VYIPKNQDTLWELSKSLGVSEEDIMALNPDLSFPLSGDERIIIYREIK
jgi:LysM repeat protein